MKKLYDKYNVYVCISLLIIISIMVYLYVNKNCSTKVEYIKVDNTTKEEVYYVDIKGEVINPGVYEVNSNDRIINVIETAGGLTKNADISLLNLSKKVIDEMNIKIYSKSEVKNAIKKLDSEPTIVEVIKEIEKECVCPDINDACINNPTNNEQTLININTATKEELMTITGIGESKANYIIEYRSVTPFNAIEDIKNVKGIGNSIFEKIKDYITI